MPTTSTASTPDVAADLKGLTERIGVGPQPVGQGLVDESHVDAGAGLRLGRGEVAAAEDREPEGAEVVGARGGVDRGDGTVTVHGSAQGRDPPRDGEHAEGNDRGQARGFHLGKGSHPLHEGPVGLSRACLGVPREARIELHHHLAVETEAGVGLGRTGRSSNEQPGRGHEDEGERHLGRDHQVPGRDQTSARDPAGLPGLLLQVVHGVAAGEPQARSESRHHRAQDAEGEGDGEDAHVGSRVEDELDGHVGADRAHEGGGGPDGQEQAESTAHRRQDEGLGEELAQDPPASAADGDADGDLLAPSLAPGQEHVGQVQARDEEHDPRHGEEQDRGGPKLRVVVRLRAHGHARHGMEGEGLVLVLARVGLLEALGQGGEAVFGEGRGHPGLEAPHEHQRVVGPVGEMARALLVELHHRRLVEAQGEPQLGRNEGGRAREPGRE